MPLDQILYTSGLFLIISMPLMSIYGAPIAVLLPSAKKPISRDQYQSAIIRYFAYIIGLLILGIIVASFITVDLSAVQTEEQYFNEMTKKLLLQAAFRFVPIFIYSIITFKVAQRLVGMGYSRFYAVICIVPFVGPAMVAFLFFTIRGQNEETPYEERPNYLGQVYGNEVYLEDSMGRLAKFDWSEYVEAAEDAPDRKLVVNFNGVKHEINANVWSAQEFLEELPSVSPDNDGEIFAFYREDGFTDKQILADADALYDAIISDLDMLKHQPSESEKS